MRTQSTSTLKIHDSYSKARKNVCNKTENRRMYSLMRKIHTATAPTTKFRKYKIEVNYAMETEHEVRTNTR